MKTLKQITATMLAIGILLSSGCNSQATNKENLESILQSNQNTSDTSSGGLFEKPGHYGYSINSDKCDNEYNGEEITATYTITNSGDEAIYGVTLYVNGVQTEFKLNESTETETNHIFNFELGEVKELNFKFTPYNCKAGDTARIDMILMVRPDYTLPNAKYFGFGNNHSISSAVPFEVKINKDAPEKDSGGVYENVTVTDITKEIEEENSEKDYLTGEIIDCHLDTMTKYQLYDKDELDPFLSCDDSIELTVRSLGLPSEFYAAVYIDHKIMPAFDGKCYAYFNVDRQHVSTAKVKIDTSELPDGIHHIYMQIIPVGESSTELNDCRKTTSKLLVKGEKYISEAQDTYDKFVADQNNNNKPTESKDENTSTENSNIIFTELSNAVIQDMTKIDENTLLAIGQDNLVLVDTNTYKITKEIPRTTYMQIQKIDNGFVTIDGRYESCSYDIYDIKGNVTKHVDIPTRPLQGEELELGYSFTEKPVIDPFTLHVSSDAKGVIYFSENGYCANSIDLDNEIVIQPVEDFNGGFEEFYQMTGTVLYKDDIIYGTAGKFNSEKERNEHFFASLNLKTKEWTVYHQLNRDQQLFNKDDFVDN
ncbi:MAG: hypothetical protein IKT78_04335, partial [Ruminiclostridium sp.]|nr:hypothetical protein [Ruminiclostridium sp.]